MSDPTESSSTEEVVSKWCFTWDPTDVPGSGVGRMALLNKNKWQTSVINVAFLDGVKSVQDKIKNVVKEWTAPGMANLHIVFVKDPNKSDVRITFAFPGSWSVIGTSCQALPKTIGHDEFRLAHAEVQAGRNTARRAARIRTRVRGSFTSIRIRSANPVEQGGGHQGPFRPAEQLGCGQDSAQHVRRLQNEEVDATEVDPLSIMMYPIMKNWVTDPKYVAPLNTDLSPTDKKKIHSLYP